VDDQEHTLAFSTELLGSEVQEDFPVGEYRWLTPTGRRAAHAEPRMTDVLDRDQVLHVARLARLELDPDEVQRMATELSNVLEHVDRIRELDLEGTLPTSHAVAVGTVTRPDEPRSSLTPEQALASAPEPVDGGFGVPSPGPAGE
jgi:aspartyl-tRNA(Asn)/glutamyl-tRNA(Gln) amidotransferase subunit C